jgi:hypothetical protein
VYFDIFKIVFWQKLQRWHGIPGEHEISVNQRVLGSSPREGASNNKPLQKCEGFFDFTCQSFVKLSPSSLQTKVALIKKSHFLIKSKNISFIIPVVVYCLLKK